MAARSQALAFGELLAGGVLVAAGVTGHSVRDILAGVSSPISPLVTDFPTGAASSAGTGAPAGPGAGHMFAKSAHGAVNPVPGWSLGRVDQGVDFAAPAGTPIYAPLAGRVIKTGAPGWPGGGGVLLQLANKQIMYIYEGLTPTVHSGQAVQPGQVVARSTGTSIEIGWADHNGVPLSHASYTEGKVTEWGQRMLSFLRELGVGH